MRGSMYCRKCGYPLGADGPFRCAECGQPFIADAPDTYRTQPPPSALRRAALIASRIWGVLIAVFMMAMFGTAWLDASTAIADLILVPITILVHVLGIVTLIFAVAARVRHREPVGASIWIIGGISLLAVAAAGWTLRHWL